MPAALPLDLTYLSNPSAARLERLGAQLHRRLAGGDVSADSPYTRVECELALEQYRGEKQAQVNKYNADRLEKYGLESTEYYRKQYYEDYEALYKLGGTQDAWVRTFTLTVNLDTARGLKYCLLPAQFVDIARYQNLPGEEGIKQIDRVKWAANLGFTPRFVPFPNGAHHTFMGLYRQGLQGNYGYWRDSDGNGGDADRVYFAADPNCPALNEGSLRVSLIIRPTRDTLPEPGLLYDVSDMDMLMGAESIILRRAPEDRVSDNAPAAQTQAA